MAKFHKWRGRETPVRQKLKIFCLFFWIFLVESDRKEERKKEKLKERINVKPPILLFLFSFVVANFLFLCRGYLYQFINVLVYQIIMTLDEEIECINEIRDSLVGIETSLLSIVKFCELMYKEWKEKK